MAMDYTSRLLLDTSEAEANATRLASTMSRVMQTGQNTQPTGLNRYTNAIHGMNTMAQQTVRTGLQQLSTNLNRYMNQGERFVVGQTKGGAVIAKTWDQLSRSQLRNLSTDEQARVANLRFIDQFGKFAASGRITERSLTGMNTQLGILPKMEQDITPALNKVRMGLNGYQGMLLRAEFEQKQFQKQMQGIKPISVDTARTFQYLQSGAQGLMLGANLAKGSISGAAFSLIFMRLAIIPVMLAMAALTAGVLVAIRAWNEFKNLLTASSAAAATFEQRGQQLASYFKSATVGMQLMAQSFQLGAQYGIDPTQISQGLQTLQKLRINQDLYRQSVIDTSVATGKSIPEVSKDLENLFLTQRFSYKETAEAYAQFARDYNLNLTTGMNSAQVASIMEQRYANAASDAAATYAGSVARLGVTWTEVKIIIGTVVNQYLRPVIELMLSFVTAMGNAFQSVAKTSRETGNLNKSVTEFQQAMLNLVPIAQALGYFLGYVMYDGIQKLAHIVKVASDAFIAFWHWTKPVRDLLQNIIQFVKELLDKFLSLPKPLLEAGLGFLGIGAALHIINDVGSPVAKVINDIAAAIKTAGENAAKYPLQGYMPNLGKQPEQGQQALPGFDPKAPNIDVSAIGKSIASKIATAVAAALGAALGAALAGVSLTDILGGIGFLLGGIAELITSVVLAPVAAVIAVALSVALAAKFPSQAGAVAATIVGMIVKAIAQVAFAIPTFIFGLVKTLLSVVRGAFEFISGGDLINIVGGFGDALGGLLSGLGSVISRVVDGDWGGAFQLGLSLLLGAVSGFFAGIFSSAVVQGVVDAARAFASTVATWWDNYLSAPFNVLTGSVGGWLEDFGTGFKNRLGEMLGPTLTAQITDTFGAIRDSVGSWDGYDGILGGIHTVLDGLARGIKALPNPFQGIMDNLAGLFDAAISVVKAFSRIPGVSIAEGIVGDAFGHFPGRALGGPVNSGQTYRVGEHGPELLHMGSSGYISPNANMSGGSGGIYIDMRNSIISSDDAANKLAEQMAGKVSSALGLNRRMSLHRI